MLVEKAQGRTDDTDAVTCGVGILMERYRCDVDEARRMLDDWAREVAVSPEDIARWLMDDTITRVRLGGGAPLPRG